MDGLVVASLVAAASYFIFWLPILSKKFFKLVWEDRVRGTIFWYFLYWIVPLILVGTGLLNLEGLGIRFDNTLISILYGIAGGIGSTTIALWGFSQYFKKAGLQAKETVMRPFKLQLAVNSPSEELYWASLRAVAIGWSGLIFGSYIGYLFGGMVHMVNPRWSRAAKRVRGGGYIGIAMIINILILATLYVLTQSIFAVIVSHYIFDYGLFYGIRMLHKKHISQ